MGLVCLWSGCATDQNVAAPRQTSHARSQIAAGGTIVLANASGPAEFGFQKAKGKLGSAKEAILDSAELGLSGPAAGMIATGAILSWDRDCVGPDEDPIFYAAVAGAAGGVTAVGAVLAGPVVGARGLIRSLQRVSPGELAEREIALSNAMSRMAAQKPFRDALLQAAGEKSDRGLVFLDSPERGEPLAVGAILEARVEQLRLERVGSSEGSYCLLIKAHARLTRRDDGAVCFEQNAEYRSGTSLFLDWTLEGAIQGVAETGYGILARFFIDQLLSSPTIGK